MATIQNTIPAPKPVRDQALDALRGFAILAMVLSSSIAFGVLPAWMYHAQVPPPGHVYDPTIPGISWVDLVFPFFLFSLGAAIPLSLGKKIREGAGLGIVSYTAARRWVLLVFFAFFTVYMRPLVLSAAPSTGDYLLSIGAFVLLALQFHQPQEGKYRNVFRVVRILAYTAAIGLLYFLPFRTGKGFSTERIDIIILVLGNMVFFGTLIWWFTRKSPLARIAVLPFIMAIFLAGNANNGNSESWNHWLYNWSPLPWMYRFYYLKYLFIILPGTIAGDWLLQYGSGIGRGARVEADGIAGHAGVAGVAGNSGSAGYSGSAQASETAGSASMQDRWIKGMAALCFVLVAMNVILLFGRHLVLNLFLSALVCAGLFLISRRLDREKGRGWLLSRCLCAGGYLLFLGLFFEAYEGGIKKDPSTYSYYFVCAGLAFFMLAGFYGLQLSRAGGAIVNFLGLNGRNPMVAYTAGNLLLIPALQLTGGIGLLDGLNHGGLPGVLRGLIFTGIVSLITIFFTRRKWFWKT